MIFLASESEAIGKKVEHVGSTFAEFREKVEAALHGLDSEKANIEALLKANAALFEQLPLFESRLSQDKASAPDM